MIEQNNRHQHIPRRLLLGLPAMLALCAYSGVAWGQESGQQTTDKQAEAEQAAKSLQEKLEATEKIRQQLEKELAQMRAQLRAIQQRGSGLGASVPAARRGGPQGGIQAGPADPASRSGLSAISQSALLRREQQTPTEATHIKVFRLKHRNVEEMRQIVMVLDTAGTDQSRSEGAASTQTQQSLPSQSLRVVADRRTRSLIVRASKKVLEDVARLVAKFDVAPGREPLLDGQKEQAFTVRHADPENLLKVLTSLGLNAVRTPNTNTLTVRGPEETIKEVGELIAALDVAPEDK